MDILNLMDGDSEIIDKDKIHKWLNMLNTPLINYNINEITIDPYLGVKYKGNFTGLLKNELNIPNSAIFLNTIINGFDSSLDYDGRLYIKLLEPDVVINILEYIRSD